MSSGTVRRRVARGSLVAVGLGLLSCAEPIPLPCGMESPIPIGTLHVLFVGNSLTYYHKLPVMVERMGDADERPIETVDVSLGGVSLKDHWYYGPARDTLAAGGWDVVVLQGGVGLPESPDTLVTWVRTWADAVRAADAKPALYMVYPEQAHLDQLPGVIAAHRTAAEEARAGLYAVGEAWQAALGTVPGATLYDADGIHPSVMGSYLAALTMYRGLTNRPAPSLTDLGISPEDDALLQAAAQAGQPLTTVQSPEPPTTCLSGDVGHQNHARATDTSPTSTT